MPTYEYECKSCEHHFEIEQSIKDDPLTMCPNCHEDFLRRLISKTSFVLKALVGLQTITLLALLSAF